MDRPRAALDLGHRGERQLGAGVVHRSHVAEVEEPEPEDLRASPFAHLVGEGEHPAITGGDVHQPEALELLSAEAGLERRVTAAPELGPGRPDLEPHGLAQPVVQVELVARAAAGGRQAREEERSLQGEAHGEGCSREPAVGARSRRSAGRDLPKHRSSLGRGHGLAAAGRLLREAFRAQASAERSVGSLSAPKSTSI